MNLREFKYTFIRNVPDCISKFKDKLTDFAQHHSYIEVNIIFNVIFSLLEKWILKVQYT